MEDIKEIKNMKNNNKSLIKVFVVGDKFKCFAKNKNIIGISQLEKMVSNGNITLNNHYQIYIGQGVCEMQIKKIHQRINKMKLNNRIVLQYMFTQNFWIFFG